MKRFPSGHATHPQWRMAVALVLAQLRAQMALPEYAPLPTLALLYITDHYASTPPTSWTPWPPSCRRSPTGPAPWAWAWR
jgi:hypothetical protein